MFANNEAPPVDTMNVIADTKFGDPNAAVVVGSHLDGVLAGNTRNRKRDKNRHKNRNRNRNRNRYQYK